MNHPPSIPDDDAPVEVDITCLQAMDGLLAGERAAVATLYQRFVGPLLVRAERMIPARHRGKVFAESVVHSVMASLLALDSGVRDRLARYEIRTWAQLYGLLARITARKCLNKLRRFETQARSAGREQSLSQTLAALPGPTAEDEAAFAELLTEMWATFTDSEKEILRRSLEGYTVQEIADEVQYSTTTVKNVRRKLSRWLQRRVRRQASE